jgi:hypothetical protein
MEGMLARKINFWIRRIVTRLINTHFNHDRDPRGNRSALDYRLQPSGLELTGPASPTASPDAHEWQALDELLREEKNHVDPCSNLHWNHHLVQRFPTLLDFRLRMEIVPRIGVWLCVRVVPTKA